jgi:diguanylate cyclase (GGDEF)-like protein
MTRPNRSRSGTINSTFARNGPRLSLLVASPDPTVFTDIEALAARDFDIRTAKNGGEALEALAQDSYDLLLADQALGPLTGLELLGWAEQHRPRTTRVLLIDPPQIGAAGDAIAQGNIYAAVRRPLEAEGVLNILSSAAYQCRWAPLIKSQNWPGTQLQQQLLKLWQSVQEAVLLFTGYTADLEAENRDWRRRALEAECGLLTDHLTGVFSRAAIEEIAEHEVRRRARYGEPLAVGILDADHFREINRVHGHPGGDAALAALGRALAGSLRGVDRVGRVGGEEFLIVAPQADLAGATALAERVREAVTETPVYYNSKQIGLTVSLGFAVAEGSDKDKPDLATLWRAADEALVEAKLNRNRAVVRSAK